MPAVVYKLTSVVNMKKYNNLKARLSTSNR